MPLLTTQLEMMMSSVIWFMLFPVQWFAQKKYCPLLMTSIASVIGMLPMAFGRGIGYEIRSSCGIGVVGGLLFAMFLTLYFIPAAFYVSHKNK